MNRDKSQSPIQREFLATESDRGLRLDRFLAGTDPDRSRSQIQREIAAGRVSIGGRPTTQPSTRIRPGERILWLPEETAALVPIPHALPILYEDDDLVVIDKPLGMVVHPGAGTVPPTLVEALLVDRTLPESDDPVRPGIVHRLDKETTGVIVVAKTPAALASLKTQFARREIEKRYLAVVDGIIEEESARIDAPIGRDPARPRRMRVLSDGRSAQTEFRVIERFAERTACEVQPLTGRTHQIRVHFAYIQHPVVGDRLYGGPPNDRILLHAWTLCLTHPATGRRIRFEAPPPEGFPTPRDA